MFRSYVIMIQVPGFFDGVFYDLLGPWRLGQFAHRHHVRPALDQFFNFQPNLAQIHVKVLQDVSADSAPLLNEAEQNMFGANVLMIKALGFLIRQGHYFSGPVRKSFKHVHLLLGRQG